MAFVLLLMGPAHLYGKPPEPILSKFPAIHEVGYHIITDLKLPSLFDFPSDCDVYRFVFSNCFDSGAVITMTKEKGRTLVGSIQPTDHLVNGTRGTALTTNRSMTSAEWLKLDQLVKAARFWESPSPIENQGLDGYVYILEARVKGRYHYVARWSPDSPQDRAFVSLSDWILGFSKRVGTIKVESEYNDLTTKDGTPIILGK